VDHVHAGARAAEYIFEYRGAVIRRLCSNARRASGVSFWPRVGARLIDIVVHYLVSFFAGILFVVMLVVASGGHVSPLVLAKLKTTGLDGFIFALLGSFAYHVVFTAMHGSTVGKLMLSMVVAQEDGSPCGLKSSVQRELGYFVDALFFGIIGYMAMQKSVKEQRHGDEWAHTVVCKRSLIAPDKLRGGGRFAVALVFAMAVDAALVMVGLLLVIAG
jgi:uncharacterized RDD family membrane protein YckC